VTRMFSVSERGRKGGSLGWWAFLHVLLRSPSTSFSVVFEIHQR
jgi:hypothetical protein